MVMSDSHYHGSGFEPMYRSPTRPITTTAYYGRSEHYNRSEPYGYHEHRRHHTRQDYEEPPTIQDEEPNNPGEEPTRRRIAVACSRCRKRKIKCSGDPGDGSGCDACKSVGHGLSQECTFIRVKAITIGQVEMLRGGAYAGLSDTSPIYEHDGRGSQRQQRSRRPLPTLQTRSAYEPGFDSTGHNSPIDAYTYASSAPPRHDSLSTAYGADSMRSWGTTGSAVLPPTPTYCDSYPASTYGSMSCPASQSYSRLPSLSGESFSALNMGHLNSSLPFPGTHDRTLPMPYTSQYPPATIPQPQSYRARTFGSLSTPRIPANAVHTHHPPPWQLDTGTTRTGPIANYSALNGLPIPAMSEPALSYQFNTAGPPANHGGFRGSPDLSPASGHPQSNSFDGSSTSSRSGETMQPHPLAGMHYYQSAASQQEDASLTRSERPPSSHPSVMHSMPSLYSFGQASTDQLPPLQEPDDDIIPSSGVSGGTTYPLSSSGVSSGTTYPLPIREGRHPIEGDGSPYIDDSNSGYQTSLQHPRPLPQHSASVETLCRQAPFEQPASRSSGASRMSIQNLGGSYHQ